MLTGMADSWANDLYYNHGAVAVSLLMSESSLKLLDVLVKSTSRSVLQNVGSMVDLGTPESAEIAALLRKKLENFESKTGKEACDVVQRCCKSHLVYFTVEHYKEFFPPEEQPY